MTIGEDLLEKGTWQLDLNQKGFPSEGNSMSKETEAEFTLVDPEDSEKGDM